MRNTGKQLNEADANRLIRQIADYAIEAENNGTALAQNPKLKEKTKIEALGFRDAGQYVGYMTIKLLVEQGLIATENHFMKTI